MGGWGGCLSPVFHTNNAGINVSWKYWSEKSMTEEEFTQGSEHYGCCIGMRLEAASLAAP